MIGGRPAGVALVLALAVAARAEEPPPAGGPAPAAPWKPALRGIAVPMRDGASLAADVYLPAKPGRYPAILVQTPYDRTRLGAWLEGVGDPPGDAARGAESDLRRLVARERTAWVLVDWRGFFGSRAAERRGPADGWRRGQDGYDAVEWTAAQPWCDGNVGTWGGSALGKQQLDTAAEKPPHLRCCVPLIASMGITYEGFHEGGILLEGHLRTLDRLGFGVSGFVQANPRADAPLWRILRRATFRPEAIDVPCLFITGWWDHFPDQVIETFEGVVAGGGAAARQHSRLLVGPWDHVSIGLTRQGDRAFPEAEGASAEAARAFLDRFLRGDAPAGGAPPRVLFLSAGEAQWEGAESWSAFPRAERTFALTHLGTILAAADAPRDSSGARTYESDPSRPIPTLGGANLPPMAHGPRRQDALDARPDVLAWTSAPLEAPLRVNGNALLRVAVSADRRSVDLMARLCEATGEREALLVADAAVRVEELRAGEVRAAALRFPALAYTFARGSRLRVYLSSSNWPRYAVNPQTGASRAGGGDPLPATVRIGDPGTSLVLPVPAGPPAPARAPGSESGAPGELPR